MFYLDKVFSLSLRISALMTQYHYSLHLFQIVWDPVKKKWTNADGTEDEETSAAPPPKDTDLLSMSTFFLPTLRFLFSLVVLMMFPF